MLSLFFACTSSILFFPQSDHTQTQLTLSRQRRDKYISTLYSSTRSMGSSHPRISSRRREDWGTSHTLLLRSCQNSIFIDHFCKFAVLPYLGLCKVKKFVILINGTVDFSSCVYRTSRADRGGSPARGRHRGRLRGHSGLVRHSHRDGPNAGGTHVDDRPIGHGPSAQAPSTACHGGSVRD